MEGFLGYGLLGVWGDFCWFFVVVLFWFLVFFKKTFGPETYFKKKAQNTLAPEDQKETTSHLSGVRMSHFRVTA